MGIKNIIGELRVNGKPVLTEKYSEGLTYELSDDEAYYIVTGMGTCVDSDLIIPPEHEGLQVKEIGDSAFAGTMLSQNSKIKSVIFPHTITKIGNYAFQYCGALNKISLNEGLLEIGDGAFHWTYLQNIILPNTLVSIGQAAFNSTKIDFIIIPKNVTTIGANIVGGSNITTNILPTIYCVIKESERPSGWDEQFDTYLSQKLKVVWNFANDFIAVNDKLGDVSSALDLLIAQTNTLIGGTE